MALTAVASWYGSPASIRSKSLIDERTGGLGSQGHLCKNEAQTLEVTDRLAKLVTLADVTG